MWYVLCVRALMPFHMYIVHRTMYVLYVCGSVADSTIISEAQKLWIVIIVVELTLSPALSLLVAHTHPLSPSLSDSLSLFALLFLGCIIFRVLQHAHFSKSRFHSLLSDTVFCSPSCCWCHPPSRFAHALPLSLYRCVMVNVLCCVYMCICARPRTFTNFCNIVKFLCIACLLSFLWPSIYSLTLRTKIQPF